MEYRIFKDGENLCSYFFNNELDLMLFFYTTLLDNFEIIISYNSCIYRFYCCFLNEKVKSECIYDFLKYIKDLKKAE